MGLAGGGGIAGERGCAARAAPGAPVRPSIRPTFFCSVHSRTSRCCASGRLPICDAIQASASNAVLVSGTTGATGAAISCCASWASSLARRAVSAALATPRSALGLISGNEGVVSPLAILDRSWATHLVRSAVEALHLWLGEKKLPHLKQAPRPSAKRILRQCAISALER